MKQVLVRNGHAAVTDVPAPLVGAGNLLVRVRHSCISAGTELAGLKDSGVSAYNRLLRKPGTLQKGLEFIRDQGVSRGWKLLTGELAGGEPTGYSAAGEVIETGAEVLDFKPGDLVACAGVGVAYHAELIDVPVNLAVRLPEDLPTHFASTVALGAIALQGVRRCNPSLGEVVLVVGLGILGQLTVQLLLANGCRVIGADLDPKRVEVALENGMTQGIYPGAGNVVERVRLLTEGSGADAAIVAASTPSHEVISQAMNACRKKGRVVLVGNVGLNLNRRDFYAKELDFLISCSYGPGRYDASYEEGGQDYPLAYVRWTENRNMQAYLALLASGQVNLGKLPGQMYRVEEAAEAFDSLVSPADKPLLVFLSYPGAEISQARSTVLRRACKKAGRIGAAVVGAGGFAQGMHLPNLVKLRDWYDLRAVVSRTGAGALNAARRFEAAYATTDFEQVLNDPDVDLVLVCTRHHLHARMALKALRAGKHVFVEKPLCLTGEELREIRDFFSGNNGMTPLLMTGFNRRFSPPLRRVRQWLEKSAGPMLVNYRMNAGFIPLEHWVHGQEGGGRNIGEACHIYDLFNYLTQSTVASVQARGMRPSGNSRPARDNFVATITYRDGSVCTLTYSALGSREYPKEQMELFADGKVISLCDFESLRIAGAASRGWSSSTPQKGQLEELQALAAALQSGGEWPISLEQQLSAMDVSFQVEEQL